MKKLLFSLPLLFVLVVGFTAEKILDDKLKSLLQQFKINKDAAEQSAFYSIMNKMYYIPNVTVLKDLALNDRVSIIQSIGNNVKEYTRTKEFIEKYNQLREERKPTPPEKPKTVKELKEEQKASLTNSIAETEKAKKNAAKDQQSMFDEIIASLKQQLNDIDNPEKTIYPPDMDEYLKQSYQMQLDDFDSKVAEWEIDYPINNPNNQIKKWINAFLEKTSDINFEAKTKQDKDGKIKFVDNEYEYKDSQWKLYYRAGKESVNAARTFAQNWLNELK